MIKIEGKYYFTPKEYADRIGYTTDTVYFWLRNNHIPSVKKGRRYFIPSGYREEDFDEVQNNCRGSKKR